MAYDMKKLIAFALLLSAVHAEAQLTTSDVLRIGRMFTNPYNINARSFIEARDELQLMGYPLMRFVPNSVNSDRFFSFYYQRSGSDREKVVVVSQYYNVNNTIKVVYNITVTTSDIDQFNAMLKNAMSHPDFEAMGPNLFTNNFKSKTSTGVKEQLNFSKGYSVLPSGEMNIQVPIIYTISYNREN